MKVCILAGGKGSRLWPASRTDSPKQFLSLFGSKSLLQETGERFLYALPPTSIFFLTTAAYAATVERQVRELHPFLRNQIVLEPEARNTGPALAWALSVLPLDPEEPLLLAPADHRLFPLPPFWAALTAGCQKAQEGYIVLFGVPPTRPETGYGYIRAQGLEVKQFVEKPSRDAAEIYVSSGEYVWNSGLCMATPATWRAQISLHCPALLEAPFAEKPSLSIDHALLERSKKVAMIPLEGVVWSDVGSWESLCEVAEKDGSGNVVQGDVVAVETRDSLVSAQSRLVVAVGLRDMVVVETEDAVLVGTKGGSQQLQQALAVLQQAHRQEPHTPRTVARPWGYYTVLLEGERFKIKKLHIFPLCQLSLQLHYHRSEHWVVVSGTARVKRDTEEKYLHEGESFFVPQSTLHQVENPGKVPLQIIEIQVGEYLGEDDIVRVPLEKREEPSLAVLSGEEEPQCVTMDFI